MTASAHGAEPLGASGEQSAGRNVQQMFNQIAPRYDLLNHVLSANVDRLWWRRTAQAFAPTLQRPEATILDMCCGTGDLTLALLRLRPPESTPNCRPILALDFAHEMLVRAERKFSHRRATTIEADALHMPLAASSVDLIVTAFGFRNLANYQAGLAEMCRVLRPGGEVGILEFNEPDGPIGKLYRIYFRRVLPRIGQLLSGAAGPYAYLPQSVHRFPAPAAMLRMMETAGFTHAEWTPYTFGIAGLYRAVKA